MEQAKDILPDLYRRGTDRDLEEWELVRAYWAEAVGRRIAMHTRPVRLKGQTLVVEVDDETWRVQIDAIRGRILNSLKTELTKSVVQKLELRAMLPERRQPGQAAAASARAYSQSRKRADGA